MVKLGDRVKDQISGLKGIVTARHEYLYGCVRISVTPEEQKEGKPAGTAIFDEGQLLVLKQGAVEATPINAPKSSLRPTGGPRPDPVRPGVPVR